MMVKPRENRVPIMLSEEELTAIDDWRFQNRIATRSDAIRRLCQLAMTMDQRIKGIFEARTRATGAMVALGAAINEEVKAEDGYAALPWNVFKAADAMMKAASADAQSEVAGLTKHEAFVHAVIAVSDLDASIKELTDAHQLVAMPGKVSDVLDLLDHSRTIYDNMLGRSSDKKSDSDKI